MERVVLVTGASSGIGREIVRKLAGSYEVIIHYNNSRDDAFKLKEEIDRLYFKCNNGDIHIAKDAYEVHGISEDDVKDLPTFNDRAKEVFDFVNGFDIGGYNCAFYDIPILYSSFLRAGLNWNYRALNVYDVYLNYKLNKILK